MQIKAITVNAADMAAGRDIQGNRLSGVNQAQTENSSMFGAECRVTISRDGRNLSRQQAAQTKEVQSVKAEKMLLRSQKEAEQDKDIRDGYREKLDEIDKKISALNSSYAKQKDKETIEEQQEVLRAMRNQKVHQQEQNEKRAREAREMAMQSAGYQDEIDENNRELLTLLKTMEEAEKAEDEREGDEAKGDGSANGTAGDASGTGNSVSDVIRNSATQFMMSSVEREWGVQEAIAGLADKGHQRLKLADTITRNVLDATKNIRTAMDDELYTDERIEDMMRLLVDGTTKPGVKIPGELTGMALNYKDVRDNRGRGLQNLQDAQEARIKHLADDPLKGMQETKKSMHQSAVDATLGEARQSGLDKASRELEDEVKKLIDERNDVDRIRQKKEEEIEEKEERAKEAEEQAKEAEEQAQAQGGLLQPEEQEREAI